jgi:hypothetical protein
LGVPSTLGGDHVDPGRDLVKADQRDDHPGQHEQVDDPPALAVGERRGAQHQVYHERLKHHLA